MTTAHTESIESLLATLSSSLEDFRLSPDEKNELTLNLAGEILCEEDVRRIRNRAFDLVRASMHDRNEFARLKWLEGVLRWLEIARPQHGALQQTAFFSPGSECLEAIQMRLRNTKSSADICVFTLSDDRISDEVVAVHRRGVRVRVITDNKKEFDRGSDVGRLREAGVPIAVDRTEAHMHHKFAIFDGTWLLSGSYNWTRSASEANEENLIQSKDMPLLAQFSRRFELLWAALSS